MSSLLHPDEYFSPSAVPATVKGPEQGAPTKSVTVSWQPSPDRETSDASMGAGVGAALNDRQLVDLRKDQVGTLVIGSIIVSSRDGVEPAQTWIVDRVDDDDAQIIVATVRTA